MSVIAKHSMFDGLFSVALKPTGAFREDLKSAGFDPDRPKPEYALRVWHDCVDVAARHLYPNERRERAWELVGERFIEGYLQTLVGKLIAVALPFLSPQSFVQRAPRFMSTGLVGAEVKLDWKGSKSATVTLTNVEHPACHLLAGVIAVSLGRINARGVKIQASPFGNEGSQVTASWD